MAIKATSLTELPEKIDAKVDIHSLPWNVSPSDSPICALYSIIWIAVMHSIAIPQTLMPGELQSNISLSMSIASALLPDYAAIATWESNQTDFKVL